MTAPERIYIDKGPRGGWMHRHERMPDTQHEYILHTRAALAASPLVAEIVAEAVQWQPIETAPKGELIDIWLKEGKRWCDCYYDHICDEWRTSRPAGKLVWIRSEHVSHWMPRPAPPAAIRARGEG